MSYKTKKLSIGKNKFKNKGFLLYQNIWYQSKLTKKQQKKKWTKGKIFSIEQMRNVRKYKVLNTVAKNYCNFTIKKNTFNNVEWKKRRIADKIFSIIIEQKLNSDFHQKQNERTSIHSISVNNTEFTNKKALSLIAKPFWFFDKAVPIQGASFAKKAKRLYMAKMYAYKTIESWLQIFNKKQIKVFLNVQKKQNLPKHWNAIILMESLYSSILRKTAFFQNAQQSNTALNQFIAVNGKKIKKAMAVYKPGQRICLVHNTLPNQIMKSICITDRSEKHTAFF